MKLFFGGSVFELHPAGVLLGPAQDMLIVSDLHLEKGSHFARRGFFLPPYDSRDTLERLLGLCESTNAKRLLILGDGFHDAQGFDRLGDKDRALFAELTHFNPVWIIGNHDKEFVPAGFEVREDWQEGFIMFRHQADPAASAFEISGHYHPKADIQYKGERFSRDCFIEDGRKLILPAFGAYTGGLSVSDPAIRSLFGAEFMMHLVGNSKIISLSSAEQAP